MILQRSNRNEISEGGPQASRGLLRMAGLIGLAEWALPSVTHSDPPAGLSTGRKAALERADWIQSTDTLRSGVMIGMPLHRMRAALNYGNEDGKIRNSRLIVRPGVPHAFAQSSRAINRGHHRFVN